MSWQLDEDDGGSSTTLQWWKENFIIAASDLFKVVDNCVGMDIQVHNLGWYVQEVQVRCNARCGRDFPHITSVYVNDADVLA